MTFYGNTYTTIVQNWLYFHARARARYLARFRARGWEYWKDNGDLYVVHPGNSKLWAFWDGGIPTGVTIGGSAE